MERPLPPEAGEVDEEDRPQLEWWKCKKWTMHILGRFYDRYASPQNIEKCYTAFSDYYLKTFNGVCACCVVCACVLWGYVCCGMCCVLCGYVCCVGMCVVGMCVVGVCVVWYVLCGMCVVWVCVLCGMCVVWVCVLCGYVCCVVCVLCGMCVVCVCVLCGYVCCVGMCVVWVCVMWVCVLWGYVLCGYVCCGGMCLEHCLLGVRGDSWIRIIWNGCGQVIGILIMFDDLFYCDWIWQLV